MMKYYIFLFCIIVLNNLSPYSAESLKAERIADGILAKDNEFKYQVSVKRNNRLRCGGAILAEYFIATAAHCFINITTGKFIDDKFTVVVSALDVYDLRGSAITEKIIRVFVPDEFRPNREDERASHNFEDDLAIAKLKNGLKLIQRRHLSTLSTACLFAYEDKTMILTGYGFYRSSFHSNPVFRKMIQYRYFDGRLRYATVNLISPDICHKYYSDFNPTKQMCARLDQNRENHLNDVCAGDNGSPVVYKKEVLIGVVSYIEKDCRRSLRPMVITKIQYYSQFIDNVIYNRKTDQMRVARWRRPWYSFKYQFVEN